MSEACPTCGCDGSIEGRRGNCVQTDKWPSFPRSFRLEDIFKEGYDEGWRESVRNRDEVISLARELADALDQQVSKNTMVGCDDPECGEHGRAVQALRLARAEGLL